MRLVTQTIRTGLSIVTLCGAATGCAHEDNASPRELCAELVSTHCDRLADCLESRGVFRSLAERQQVTASCEQNRSEALSCASIDQVSLNFDRCIDDLQVAECVVTRQSNATSFDLTVPLSCKGVLIGG